MPEIRTEPPTSPHPTPPRREARPARVSSRPRPGARFQGSRPSPQQAPGNSEEGAREGFKGGSGRAKGPAAFAFLSSPSPRSPSLPPLGHFTPSGGTPGRARRPWSQPALSRDPRRPAFFLRRPALFFRRSSPPSAAPTRSLFGVSAALLSPSLHFLPSKVGQRPKPKSHLQKNNVSETRPCTRGSKGPLHPLLPLQPRTHRLEAQGANVPSARPSGA